MMSRFLLKAPKQFTRPFKKNLSVSRPRFYEENLEQLLKDKMHEYETKSSGGKFVEPTPEILDELNKELAAVAKRYGFDKGTEPEAWPTFNFDEPKIDPIMEPKLEPQKSALLAAKTAPEAKPKSGDKAAPKPASKPGSKPTGKTPPKPDPKKDPKKSKK